MMPPLLYEKPIKEYKSMKRRLISLLMVLALVCSLTACFDDDGYLEEDAAVENVSQDDDKSADTSDGKQSDASSDAAGDSSSVTRSVEMKVNKDGQMTISRMPVRRGGGSGSTQDGWTIFVYLCGSDLESGNSIGTMDMNEMIDGATGDKVRFIVETGGASSWGNNVVDEDKLQRFMIKNGDITLLDEQPSADMGNQKTLEAFVKWGLENYSTEHIGLALWNHGGGSITGVCFDELYNSDSIDLMELDGALNSAVTATGKRFDFVGFDACLMGTIETANIVATYADYMYGSEEMEPGGGWDYTAIGKYLSSNPDADGAELGKKVADSFLKGCEDAGDDDIATFSIIDLSKIDALLTGYNAFAKDMYESGQDSRSLAEMVRTIEGVDNFGGNNKSEGYTNMVDLGGIISSCSSYSGNAQTALGALSDAVIYKVSGSQHKGASGLSTYYPLSVQGSQELSIFGKVCVSPYYLSFVDRQNTYGVHGGDDSSYGYDDDTWFNDDGDWDYGYWSWDGDEEYDDYWGYLDGYEQSGESSYITFEYEPGFNQEGYYGFVLDDNGWEAASSVTALVYMMSDDARDVIEIGETIDVNGDWETGYFYDNFDGYWLSLPDGQNLATYIVDYTEDYVLYTSPVRLNGVDTNLRIRLDFDKESAVVEGAWDGIGEDGSSSRDIVKLKKGDEIIPLYDAFAIEGDDEFTYVGETYTVKGTTDISYETMDPGIYLYSFCIDDIYGDYLTTDPIFFKIDENGEITYDESGESIFDDGYSDWQSWYEDGYDWDSLFEDDYYSDYGYDNSYDYDFDYDYGNDDYWWYW